MALGDRSTSVDIRIDYGTRSVPTTFKRLVPSKARLQILTVPFKRDILLTLLFNLLPMGKESPSKNPSIPLRAAFWLSLNAASEF